MSQSTSPRPCPACGSGGPYSTWVGEIKICSRCGLVTCPESYPEDGTYEDSYFHGKEYADYLGEQQSLQHSMKRHLKQMKHFMPLRGKLFELGCAYGLFLNEAKAYFDDVKGMDIGSTPTQHAREAFGLQALQGEIQETEMPEDEVDVAVMWDTIEHIVAPEKSVAVLHKMIKPGGRIFLTTGDIGSRMARFRGRNWRQIHPPTHLHYFSRCTMKTLLERVGFKNVEFETAAYDHTIYNILATLELRGGALGRFCGLLLHGPQKEWFKKLRFKINLGDIMFVTATKA